MKKPLHPRLVLLIAILLPGMGQVVNGKPVRGLQFLFFTIALGWLTAMTARPDASFLGTYAGGVFVYAISVMDAYRGARIRALNG